MPHLWRWTHKSHWSRHWQGFIMTPSQIISHLYCSLSADCIIGREVKHWACKNGVVTFGWMSEETALLDRLTDRPTGWDGRRQRQKGDWQWWMRTHTIWWKWKEHDLRSAMSYTISLMPAQHSPRLRGRGRVKEPVSSISSQVLGDEPFVKVCHWLWGYLVPLMEDDSRDIRLVCVCACLSVCLCQKGGAVVRGVGFHLVSIYKNLSSIRHVQSKSASQAKLMMWSSENGEEIQEQWSSTVSNCLILPFLRE